MAKFSDNVPCPFKAEEKHYDTPEEAKAAMAAAEKERSTKK